MLKQIVCGLVVIFGLFGQASASIDWGLNYAKAQEEAKAAKKAVVLAFVGSDWCPWCQRLEKEVFSNKDFSDAVGNDFLFVFVDKPRRTPLTPAQRRHNNKLFDRFQVRGVPTIVVTNPEGAVIGRTGYRQGGAEAYASYLRDMVQNWSNTRMETLAGAIVGAAADKGSNPMALLMRYRELVTAGKKDSDAARVVREQLLDDSLDRAVEWQYQVAMVDYEALTAVPDSQRSVRAAVAPLLGFLKKHGDTEPDHAWRLHLMISQLFMSEQSYEQALEHAQLALEKAPESQYTELQALVHTLSGAR